MMGVRLRCRTLGLATYILLSPGSLRPQELRRWLTNIWRIWGMTRQQFLPLGAPRVLHAADAISADKIVSDEVFMRRTEVLAS
jgi:hypothetical protein